MSRDELHRALAVSRHTFLTGGEVGDDDCGLCRNDMEPLIEGIVAFVGEWLDHYDGPGHAASPHVVGDAWREEMGA